MGVDLSSKSPFRLNTHHFLPYPVPQEADGHGLPHSVLGFLVSSNIRRHWTEVGGWRRRVFLSWNNLLYLVGAGFGEGGKRTENRKLDASFHFPFANAYMVDCPIFLPSNQIPVKLPFFWFASSLVLFNPVDYPCSYNPYLRWHVFTLTHIIVIRGAWRN